MKKTLFAVWLILAAFTTLHAEDPAPAPDFWMLKGAEPTPENRLNAVLNAGEEIPDRKSPESFVTDTGVELLARRGDVPSEKADEVIKIDPYPYQYARNDVIYVFANTKENAKPVDGWFQLQELRWGRSTGRAWEIVEDGPPRERWFFANIDRAFFMDPATGKIGEASVRINPDTNKPEIHIRMKQGETLVLRVVRERCEGFDNHLGYGEFQSLPAWEYED